MRPGRAVVASGLLACAVLGAASCSNDAAPSESVVSDVSADAPVRWPSEGVDTEAARASVKEHMRLVGSVGCASCHDAGPLPSWATDPTNISSVELQRTISVAEGRTAEKTLRLQSDGVARLDLEPWAFSVKGNLDPAEVERLRVADIGTLDPDAWRELADAVAGSGLFRFEGDAVSSVATHLDHVYVSVERPGHGECRVGSMNWQADEAHRTFGRVIDAIEAAAARVDWQPAPR